jgi:hypothetical protein
VRRGIFYRAAQCGERQQRNASIVGEGPESLEIRVERLDDVPEVWETPVSLLKIDTEGFENRRSWRADNA